MSDPNEEKNVEELLSQLQGIFGKLSITDTAETVPPAPVPLPTAPPLPPPLLPMPTAPPALPSAPPESLAPTLNTPLVEMVFITPETKPLPEPAPALEDLFALQTPPVPEPLPDPIFAEPIAPQRTTPIIQVTSAPVLAPPDVPQVYDPSTVGCAIYYPLLREKEAKILSQKIETMTPKFTKLAFKLKVGFILSYDPRSEWREAAIERVRQNNIRALFLLSDRVLDEPKRRALQMDLEKHLIYFQEVPILSLEKKAFFTDVLLGMVFFFDTLKPKSSGE